MKKSKLLAMLLALVMCLSLTTPAFAAADAEGGIDPEELARLEAEAEENAAWELYRWGLFSGIGSDDQGFPIFDLDGVPTRAQGMVMLVRLIGAEEEAVAGTWNTPFTDVPGWAAPYVGYAYENGLTAGRSETIFDPNTAISPSEYLSFVLRALGYETGVDFAWDSAWTLSDSIGLTDGMYNENTVDFTRGDVARISEMALNTCMKDSEMTLLGTLQAAGLERPGLRCIWSQYCETCYPGEIYISFEATDQGPEEYVSFVVNSATVNGLPCEVSQLSSREEIAAYFTEEDWGPDAFSYAFAMIGLKYDQDAVEAAATETQTVYWGEGEEDFNEYPIASFKLNCTGTLPDGTEVEELFYLNYYFDGYGGPLGWF